ncbi:polysaccharide biosynthesis tyrosine autokinase [Pseudorhodoferax sp. Leaf274]|uniref:polysaccharide biosynthesis tyrosine autokinase n=1 Tax=Pseudorhodoferax sp. Leaf274 TaxID=1736318 RepID=UPI000702D4D9|nr:polysaccharide biosynthesis tyrosine autokinase [Pseudorhodoferax sp. Leaf274]KQP43204.1 tyrosine protein kinase [Pseudorhodoferax sp. Leaf274]
MQSKSNLRAMPPVGDSGQSGSSPAADGGVVMGRSIGDLIREARGLTAAQIEQVLQYQREHRVHFGEAAVALKLASRDDVLWALSQQFQYPYAPAGDVSALSPELITAIDPFSDESEMFRDVRSQLLMGALAPDQPRRALAVMSPNVGDGKSFFAANLAIAFSQLGGRTLLVDADMRTPRQQDLFNVARRAGLSNILAGRADAEVIHEVAALPGLFLLPVGATPPNPLELFLRPTFRLLLQEVCAKFDHVIVDTPAASHGADARVLAATCGAALVIGRRNTSRMHAIKELVQQIAKTRATFAGVIINEH